MVLGQTKGAGVFTTRGFLMNIYQMKIVAVKCQASLADTYDFKYWLFKLPLLLKYQYTSTSYTVVHKSYKIPQAQYIFPNIMNEQFYQTVHSKKLFVK